MLRSDSETSSPNLTVGDSYLLSWRGQVDLAADHIRAAFACGVKPRQVLEALSAAMPMTGMTTLQIGARALLQAQR